MPTCDNKDCPGTSRNKEHVSCIRCSAQFCQPCTGLKTDVVTQIVKEKVKGILWCCPECFEPVKITITADKGVEEKCKLFFTEINDRLSSLEKLLTTVNSLQDAVKDLQGFPKLSDTVGTLEKAVQNLQQAPIQSSPAIQSVPTIPAVVREEVQERNDTEARKMNLIIQGMPEAKPELEFNNIAKLIEDDLGVKIDGTAERVGERQEGEERPRLLRLTLQNMSMKKRILSKAKQLRDSIKETVTQINDDETKNVEHSNVFIRPDLTRKQREMSKNLRDRIKTLREQNPNTTYIIKNYRIMTIGDNGALSPVVSPQ